MKKILEVEVDIRIARLMLSVAGFRDTERMTDEEIFYKAIGMCEEYGVRFVSREDDG